MSKTLDVWVVTEYHIDYDDYPIGSGKIIAVTADEERATRESGWNHHEWPTPSAWPGSRTSRRREKLTVQDVPE